jgi:ribulose 1,5-bisphosphate synthetase/thiazole synthase
LYRKYLHLLEVKELNYSHQIMLVASAEEFVSKSYDYLIIGGGTAGLVLASRLSEDAGISVGVLEAGRSHLDDPKIQCPGCAELP